MDLLIFSNSLRILAFSGFFFGLFRRIDGPFSDCGFWLRNRYGVRSSQLEVSGKSLEILRSWFLLGIEWLYFDCDGDWEKSDRDSRNGGD